MRNVFFSQRQCPPIKNEEAVCRDDHDITSETHSKQMCLGSSGEQML